MALFVAIIILLSVTPLGYIHLGVINATTIQLPVIIGAIIFGWKKGAFLGGVFGLTSMIKNTFQPNATSFVFSPFVPVFGQEQGSLLAIIECIVPRVMIGVVAGLLFAALSKTKISKAVSAGICGFCGAMTNTVLVMGGIYFFFGRSYSAAKEQAYEALKNSMMLEERSLGLLKKHGFIPWDKEPENETVAKALEYCLADAGVAKVAKMLGKTEDYEYFLKRSQSYAKYFDPETRFMRAISEDGKFRTPFDPFDASHRTNDYTEGNAWQYTFLVPHDVHGLVNLFGSEKAFVTKLDSLFIVEGSLGDNASPDVSGLVGQYAQGNEPSHHVIYMYNYIGQPWKAAQMLRRMMKEMYTTQPDGLSGNEDVGQMSAWYVLSSVGLYQVEPSGGKFIIGSPLFDKATLNLGDGKTFTVRTVNNSDKNIYVQKVTLNGKAYNKTYINFNDMKRGGTLVLTMGAKPSKWGTAKKDRP